MLVKESDRHIDMLNVVLVALLGAVVADALTILAAVVAASPDDNGGAMAWIVLNVPSYIICAFVLSIALRKRFTFVLRLLAVSLGSLVIGWSVMLAVLYLGGYTTIGMKPVSPPASFGRPH